MSQNSGSKSIENGHWKSLDVQTSSIYFVSCSNVWFGLWHINPRRLFDAKSILLEEQQRYYLTHRWEDKGVHTFSKGICPKVIVKARLEFELTTIPQSSALTITPRWHSFLFLSFGLVWFSRISTMIGYLMPNSVFAFILNIWFVNTFFDTHS